MKDKKNELLTEAEAAKFLGLSMGWLRASRTKNPQWVGPRDTRSGTAGGSNTSVAILSPSARSVRPERAHLTRRVECELHKVKRGPENELFLQPIAETPATANQAADKRGKKAKRERRLLSAKSTLRVGTVYTFYPEFLHIDLPEDYCFRGSTIMNTPQSEIKREKKAAFDPWQQKAAFAWHRKGKAWGPVAEIQPGVNKWSEY